MKKKKFLAIFLPIILCVCLIVGIILWRGCSNNSNSGNNGTNVGNNSGNDDTGKSSLPTAAEIVAARAKVISENEQGYDFNLTITGDFSILGLSSSLNGQYEGMYRYDRTKNEVTFKRKTSGKLLIDSICYIFTSGDNRIKATMGGDNGDTLKKLSVSVEEDQDIIMVNLPIVSIVDSATESSISDIAELKDSNYKYSCKLSVGNNSLSKVFEKLETGISFSGIKLTENMSRFDFNLTNGRLDDFRLGLRFQISVNAASVGLDVVYTQKGNLTAISLPDTANSGILYKTADVQSEINKINGAIDDLKNDDAYSLDLTAKNEFDPGWNKMAIVDSYTARMYKNTVDDVEWFNHSYYYKSHSETAGKETYKYTIGNVNGADEDNQGTWLISRKSSNTQTKLENVTADTQFDFLTSMVKQKANEVDCIRKDVDGATVTYTLYLGKLATKSVQEKIVSMINTNSYDDVIEVDNYFNAENIIKDASIKIVLTEGKISSIVCDTELCYNPTGGEYTEYNITLNNVIELQVNKNLTKAQDYKAPTKVKGTMGIGKNLNDSEFYII